MDRSSEHVLFFSQKIINSNVYPHQSLELTSFLFLRLINPILFFVILDIRKINTNSNERLSIKKYLVEIYRFLCKTEQNLKYYK